MGEYEDLIKEIRDQIAPQGQTITLRPSPQRTQTARPNRRLYEAEINILAKNQAKEISLAEPDKDKIDFWENIQRGGWGGFFDRATFGVKPLIEAVNLHSAVKRFKRKGYSKGPIGSRQKQEDVAQITVYLEEQAEIQERGLTIAAQAGNVVFDMLPFMVEFIATGGVAALGKKAATKGITKLLGKFAATRAGRVAVGTAKLTAGAAVRTAVLPQRAALGFLQRRIPDINRTKSGQILIGEVAETPFVSAYKAIGNQFIEFFSEETGAIIGKVGGRLIPKQVKKAFETLRDAWVGGAKGRTALQFVKRIATKTGYNGVLEEMGEERLGDLMRVGFNIDQQEGDSTIERIGKALFPGKEQVFVELLAFSVPGVAQIGVANIVKRVTGTVVEPKSIDDPEIRKKLEEQETFSRNDVRDLFGVKRSTTEERQELFDDMKGAIEDVDTEAERISRREQEGEEPGGAVQEPPTGVEEIVPSGVLQEAEQLAQPPKGAVEALEQIASKYKSAEDFVFAEKTIPIELVSTPVSREQIIKATGKISSRRPNEPIVVRFKDGKIEIRDGNNRYYQKLDSGAKTIKVVFTPENDAQLTDIWNKAQAQPLKGVEGVTDVQEEKEAQKLIPPEGVTEAVPSIDDAKEQLLDVQNRVEGRPLSVTKLASSVEERKEFGESAMPSTEDRSWAKATEQGIAAGYLQNALRISDEVIQNPRPMTDLESAALIHRKGQLILEFRDLKKKISESKDAVLTQTLSVEANRVEVEFTKIRDAVDISGSERGRALNSQKMAIDENFELLPVLSLGKVKKRAELSDKQRAKFEEVISRLEQKAEQIEARSLKENEKNAGRIVKRGARKKFTQMTAEQKQVDFAQVKAKLANLLEAGCYRV